MLTSQFSKYIFWSYKKDADLPDETVIRNVSLYGEFSDLLKLTEIYSKEIIMDVLIKLLPKNRKRVNLIEKVLL